MASSASRAGERMIHQDYIARIRYSNALPPPPNPPKLLDIPNTGLASGQYTNPGFASRLARDQPLNIEADAELGMPLDLVGMPGIFDGDESSIQAPLHPPAPHPHDRALLRPLSTLGKPKFSDSGVSFLRRTEYISSYQSKSRFDSTTSKSLIDKTGVRSRKAVNLDKESPEYIKIQIENGFQVTESYVKDPSGVRHPTKRNVKLLDAKPLLPDLEAFTDAGGYITVKFLTNPVPPSSTYDIRLENSVLRPIQPTEEEALEKQAAKDNYERDPERNPPPDDTIDYELYLTETPAQALNFKRKFDVLDPENESEDLYPRRNSELGGFFRFKRVRAYESASVVGSVTEKYDEEVLIASSDGSDGTRQKAAYYYPIIQRASIRPQRTKNIRKNKNGYNKRDAEANYTDWVDMTIEEPTDEMKAVRAVFKDHPYGQVDQGEDVAEENGGRSRSEPAKSSISVGRNEEDDENSD